MKDIVMKERTLNSITWFFSFSKRNYRGECFIYLELSGLTPITRYDVCFSLSGDLGSLCHEVKTTLPIRKEGA